MRGGFRRGIPFRLFQKFIYSDNYKLDFEFGCILQKTFFEMYFSKVEHIYEFGCGTGINLTDVASIFPQKHLHGCDLTQSSIKILKVLKNEMDYDIDGHQFDFTKPDYNYHLKQNSAVYTAAALEQIGENWKKFLQYLLDEKPTLVLHLEPIAELYDRENSITDWLAYEFHQKRRYLDGYYTELLRLQKDGQIEILNTRRTYFGSWNDESYTLVVWRPL